MVSAKAHYFVVFNWILGITSVNLFKNSGTEFRIYLNGGVSESARSASFYDLHGPVL